MSDIQQTQTQPVDGGGLFTGSDGRISLRRIAAALLIVWGGGLLTASQFQTGDWLRFVPGSIMIIGALVLLGIVTIQNIQAAITAAKGK